MPTGLSLSHSSPWSSAAFFDTIAVLGARTPRRDPPVRRATSILLQVCVAVLFGVWIEDANVPFKLLRREVWLQARGVIPAGTLIPSVFLATFLRLQRAPVRVRPVPQLQRVGSAGSLRGWKLFSLSARAVWQLLEFRVRFRRSRLVSANPAAGTEAAPIDGDLAA